MFIYNNECVFKCPTKTYKINGMGDRECVDKCNYYYPDGGMFVCVSTCNITAPYINVV